VVSSRAQTVSLDATCIPNPVVNARSNGYYFTEYTPDAARALAQSASTAMTPAERLGFLGDEWFITRSGRHDIDVYLDIAAALAGDDTLAIVQEIQQRLAFIGEYVVTPEYRPAFEQWVRERFTPALEAIGVPGRDDDSEDLQARLNCILLMTKNSVF
jgi:hypothetical protein